MPSTRTSPIGIMLFVVVIIAVVGVWLYLQSDPTVPPIPSRAEVSRQWEQLARAIEAGDQARAEEIAEWLEDNGLEVELEAITGWLEDDDLEVEPDTHK